MNRQQFFNLINHPEDLCEDTRQPLQEVVDEYPYFQAARMLLVKNLHTTDNIRYNAELRIAAVHIHDRAHLYNLINNHTKSPTKAYKPKELIPQSTAEAIELEIKTDTIKEEKAESNIDITSSTTAVTSKAKAVNDFFEVEETTEALDGTAIDFSYLSKRQPAKPAPSQTSKRHFPKIDLPDTSGYLLESTPKKVSFEENRSFSDWLGVIRKQNIVADAPVSKPLQKRKNQIIDNFLNLEQPKIVPTHPKETIEQKDISEQSSNYSEDLMTETLASIYLKQKHYNKAINIFQKLRLKYPEKNVYFANRIKEIEKLINNQ
ncbi:hypothetical protein DMA11_10715 [Marinilabiliaceae bacterium JC017]|nr:hypothetical protein DMA11_10715 [Marinilabiliaceae bacterium JC017]